MQAIINRITRRGQVHQAEEQTSFWAKDSEFKACYGCDAEFTFFLRKHHCRMCGGIHCDRCSSNYLPPQAFERFNASTHQRCCNDCARSYESANGLPQNTFSSYGARGTAGASTSSTTARIPDDSRPSKPPKPPEAGTDRPRSLKIDRISSSHSMVGQQGRQQGRAIRPELSGHSMSRGPSLSSQQLPDPGGSTLHSGATKSQGDSGPKAKAAEASSAKDPALIWEEPSQMPADYGTHCLSAHPSRPGMGRQKVQSGEPLSWFESQHLSGQPTTGFADEQRISLSAVGKSKGEIPSVSRDIRRGLSVVACDHLQRMISQLLHVEQISARDVWLPVLHRLALECSLLLSASAINKRRNIDPREYVKVKKVPDNSDPSASRVVQGLVFSKNLTHRSMRREIQNARVLLLQGALEYHRQDRLLTLQTLTTQEPEYMRMSIQKACRFRPDIILVEKSVARIAQESLLNANVSLAINVKYTTLDRIAQCSRVQVASHLDELTQNNIIHCQAFRVEEVPPRILQPGEAAPKSASSKHRTLMYIEGTVEGLGCTVLLRGASEAELYRIKRIMRTAVYAAYCARLEVAFLADVCTALSLTINPVLQRAAAAQAQASEAAAGARSSLSSEHSPIAPQACKPLPLIQGRLAATWEDWGKQIGEACRTTETPVMSMSPYVKKWLVGRTGDEADGAVPANGSSGLVVSRASLDGRGGQMEDVVHSGTQAMAHVYYDQVTQVSYSFRNFKGKLVCQPPSVQKYSHYGRHDQSLMKFLNGCQPSRCDQCGDFSTLHTRQYLHGGQLLAVSFYKGHKGHVDGHDDTVWLWVRVKNRPDVQKQDCGKIKLSTSAQCLSFAHFLELMCSMTSLAVEGATLNRDVVLYFKIRHFIVCVNPNRIRPFEMVIPSQPVDCEVEAYGRAIQHEAVSLIMEVRSMFENLQNQLGSLRMLVTSADAKTGKPQSVGSPTRVRSKSVAVVPEMLTAERSPHVQQAERLFDLWQDRMEDDHTELREAIRAASHAVDTADDVQGHPALQEARFLGTHSLSQPGKRLISLHLKLISLRCSYAQKVHMWSGELIAFSRALRGRVPTENGNVKAALTSAGVLDANGSAAVSPRSPFDEEGAMLGLRRVNSSDVEGAVTALLANHNSSARELLDGPLNPLRVTITFNVITLPCSDATGPESQHEDGEEYVEVLMHAYEAGEWTAHRANMFSSAFESRANSSAKGGESPPRVDSNNSGAMPVVSLRVGMGPDLGIMASTPVPGEAGSEQAPAEVAEKATGSLPSPLKAVAMAGKPRPTSAHSAKSAPKSPLSGEAVSCSDLQLKPKDGSNTTLTAASLSSRPPFGTTDSAAALTRSSSQASSMTEASECTVIVHKEGSGATVGASADRDPSVRAGQLQRDAATLRQSTEQPDQASPVRVDAEQRQLDALKVEPAAADAHAPVSVGSPSVTGLQETDGGGLHSPSTTPSHGPAPSELDHADVALPEDGLEWAEQAAAVGLLRGSLNLFSGLPQPFFPHITESASTGGASLGGSSISANMSQHGLEPPSMSSGRRTGSFSGFPEASGLSQGTTVPQYPDVGWMRSTNGGPAAPEDASQASQAVPEVEQAAEDSVQGHSAPTSPPAPQIGLPQHISLCSAFASGGRRSSETGGPTATALIVPSSQLGGESPFAAEGRLDDAHCIAAGVLAHGAPRVSAGTDITQALSSRSSNPTSALPGGSVNGEGQESRSPSLRRSMSTGDEHELREAMIPSLLQCGIKESNIDWFMSRLKGDRAIDRTYTEDRILEGLSGWHTHLAGDEANRSTAPQPARETISPLSSLTAHLPLPARNQVLSKSGSQARSSAAGPSFGASPSDSATLQAGDATTGESSTGPAAAIKSNAPTQAEDGDVAAADVGSASAPGPQDSNKPSDSTARADAAVAPMTKEPPQANAQVAMQTPFSTVSSLQGRGSQSTLPEAGGVVHRPHASLPAASSLPSNKNNYQGIHSRAASMVGPPAGPAPLTYPDVKFRVLGPGIADMNIPIFIEEPTTAAAYFLTTPEYHEQLARIREEFAAPPKGSHNTSASDHPSGPVHTHTSSRSDAQGATPRSATAENSTPAFGSPTQSNVTELAQEGLVGAQLDTASQPEPHSTYQDDSLSATGSIPPAPSPSYADHQSAWPASEDLRLLRSSQNKSITLEFPANASSSSPHNDSSMKFTVVAYYAAQFAELRKRVVAGGELAFLLSLSRCNRWKPKGGKTMAYFAKTHDERYVVKSLSRSEKASFLEFAPHYLAHLTNMLETNIPSCLSKVLGFFQITISNEWKGDIIIMEHVFYEKTLSRSFDLKGTGRNPAKSGSSSSPNDSSSIMLDDQLKQSTFQRPLIVAPHERSKLMAALRSDTQFLSKVGVMDYSLLLGVDRVNQRLIVGIIDYIRQYTWDKHVENWVKMSGIMPGPKKEPTVISPKQYMKRFIKAMDQYFTITPFANKISWEPHSDELPSN